MSSSSWTSIGTLKNSRFDGAVGFRSSGGFLVTSEAIRGTRYNPRATGPAVDYLRSYVPERGQTGSSRLNRADWLVALIGAIIDVEASGITKASLMAAYCTICPRQFRFFRFHNCTRGFRWKVLRPNEVGPKTVAVNRSGWRLLPRYRVVREGDPQDEGQTESEYEEEPEPAEGNDGGGDETESDGEGEGQSGAPAAVPPEPDQADPGAPVCQICLWSPVQVAVIPCGHAQFCRGCLDTVVANAVASGREGICPTCRGRVERSLNIFL